jgi:phage-related protein
MDKIGDFINGIIESIKSFVVGFINDLKKIILEPLFIIVNLLKNLKEIIINFIDDFISNVEAIITKWIEKNLIYLIDKIGDFLNQVW